MAKKNPDATPKKMGRPMIEIDWEVFDKLCGLQCTLNEIASWFNCSIDTIENHAKKKYGQTFSEVYRQKSGRGKISLRRKMYEAAMGGDRVMMIWLSKQYLGMADKLEEKQEVKTEQTVTHTTYNIKWADEDGNHASDASANASAAADLAVTQTV